MLEWCRSILLHNRILQKKVQSMKNTHVLSIFLAASTAAHAMEKSNQLALPDYRATHRLLQADYRNYLQDQLEEYKKTDITKTPWNMDRLIKVGRCMTRMQDKQLTTYYIYMTKDKQQGNHFMNIAIEKDDLRTIRWITASKAYVFRFLNISQESPLDQSIKKLQPSAGNNTINATTRKIFDTTLQFIADELLYAGAGYDKHKEACVKSVLALQLQYAKRGRDFVVDPVILKKLSPAAENPFLRSSDKKYYESFLSDHYAQIADEEDGSTFTHVFVSQQDPDALCQLIKQKRVSLAKDRQGLTPIDYAVNLLRQSFTQESDPEQIQKASCCVYLLLNYFKSQDALGELDFGPCCEKHALLLK